jgi:hypothetical protein
LTDPWEALEFLRRYVDSNQSDIILVLCGGTFLIFILVLISLARGRRLRKQIYALELSLQRLNSAEELRLLRDLRGQAKVKAHD